MQGKAVGTADEILGSGLALASGSGFHAITIQAIDFPGLVRVKPNPLIVLLQPAGYRFNCSAALVHSLNHKRLAAADGVQIHGLGEHDHDGAVRRHGSYRQLVPARTIRCVIHTLPMAILA